MAAMLVVALAMVFFAPALREWHGAPVAVGGDAAEPE